MRYGTLLPRCAAELRGWQALGLIDELHYHAAKDCDVEVSAITLHATEFSFPVARSTDLLCSLMRGADYCMLQVMTYRNGATNSTQRCSDYERLESFTNCGKSHQPMP